MYIPKIYKAKDIQAVESYIRTHNFANLTGILDRQPVTSHLPLMLDKKAEVLYGHMARGNKLTKCLDGKSPLLAVFMHTHAYISSSWYDHVNVPTWNYVAVHVYGTATVLDGKALVASIRDLVDYYEAGRRDRFRMEDMDEAMLKAHLDGLVGFMMPVDRVEAAFKLSQNRHDRDYSEVIRQLEATDDHLSHKVAEAMKSIRKI